LYQPLFWILKPFFGEKGFSVVSLRAFLCTSKEMRKKKHLGGVALSTSKEMQKNTIAV
jgi:hypothetical protein